MDDHIIGQLVLQVVLIALNAVFACAEIAVLSINGTKLEQLSAEGDKRAVRLARLTCQPARFLATIQVAITLSGFLGSAFAADHFASILADWMVELGASVSAETMDAVSVVLITLILSYFTLVFGELVPKRLAMKKAEALGLALSGLVSFISKIFAPLVWVLTVSTNSILRIFGIDPNADEEDVSEETIRMMVNSGSEKGVIDSDESEIIQNVFEFDDLTVGEIGTHRTKVVALDDGDSPGEWKELIKSTSCAHYPICREGIDNVIGVLSAKRYFRLDNFSKENIMKKAVKEAFFVPESMKADALFRSMKQNHCHFAVVLDEYGGTHGIVTMNDLLSRIVGDFDDEITEEKIVPLEDGSYRIDARMDLSRLGRLFKTEIEAESATVGGWAAEQFGDIPKEGDSFIYRDLFSVEITKMDNSRVAEVFIRPSDAEK